jgi:twitching motility two-component system response regulator PilH
MPRRVLIVDDDVDLVTAARTALELAGYEVTSAHSAAEGIVKAREAQPDAIVLDVTMETTGAGFKAARTLKEEEATRHIPILMLTSINRSEAGLRYGPDEDWNPVDVFLDKPLSAEQLIEEVGKLLEEGEGEGEDPENNDK